jgi:hypothetical protein
VGSEGDDLQSTWIELVLWLWIHGNHDWERADDSHL